MIQGIVVLLVALLGVNVEADTSPILLYSYKEPKGEIAQFYKGPDAAFVYNWGYRYPGQAHTESKTRDGTVEGSYSFHDANGDIQQANYKSTPNKGFVVSQTVLAQGVKIPESIAHDAVVAPTAFVPQSPAAFSGPVEQPVEPVVDYTQEQFRQMAENAVPLDVGTEQAIFKASPAVLRAVRTGQLVPVLGVKNEIVFRVGDSLVNEAQGSVSALATILDVDTVSPRHDQQVPIRPTPGFYSALGDQTQEETELDARGLLDIETFPDGNHYVVRIPFTL